MSWLFALGQVGTGARRPAAGGGRRTGRLALRRSSSWGWSPCWSATCSCMLVRDDPPGAPPPAQEPGDNGRRAGGPAPGAVARPGCVQVLCLFMVAFAAFVTVQVLWAGPYLHDVYGLDAVERGNVLLGMALVQTLGGLVVGPLDRLFNTRKWVAVGSASLALTALIALAPCRFAGRGRRLPAAAERRRRPTAACCFAQIRSQFPDHLAGRSATIGNMAPLFGASAAADAHRLHPAAVSPPGARLLAARLPVHLRHAGPVPGRSGSRST